MNYTEKDTAYMIAEYTNSPTRETVERLSFELEKSIKSVIGKLSREGVYRREVYKTKTGEDPITKLEIVAQIAEKLDIDPSRLAGLEKSPKNVLKYVEENL